MKVLVLGATGMAGHTIAIYFKEKGHEVVCFSRTPFIYCNNIIGDVLDIDQIKEVILKGQFNAVINCIGILNQDAEKNPSLAVYLNSYLPHLIANIIKDTSTKLIHMSTDCVFRGNTGPYFENSFCDGETFYDRTKALGEVIDKKNLTFRNSIIGPDIDSKGIGLFNWFLQQKGRVNGFTGAIWTGVTTLTLAKAMEKAIEDNLCGLYNLVNNKNISKYDLLNLFNKYFNENEIIIEKQDSFKLDKTLRNTREDFLFDVPSYEQMISEMKNWVDTHPNFYAHYKVEK
jgi:dTDP-4-dehydrorhamnose reductase